jgi:outer membrane protein TolC
MVNLLITLILLLLSISTAGAESLHLTLRGAISMALKNNNAIKAAGYNVTAARQEIGIAEADYYPGLNFDESFSASNAPTQTFMMKLDEGRFTQNDFQIDNLNHPSAHHDFKTAVTVGLNLYNPSIAPRRNIAIRGTQKSESDLQMIRQDIAFQVFRNYLEIRKAGAQIAVVEKAVEEARENVRLTKVRGEAGTGLKSDELRAKTHLSSMEQQRITALNNLGLAKLRLVMVVGLPEETKVEADDPLMDVSGPNSANVTMRVAQDNRADLQSINAEREKYDAVASLARRSWLPLLNGFATYQMNSRDVPFASDNDAWVAGVSLKWQIFDGFRRNREYDRAIAGRQATAELQENKSREIAYQVRESILRRDEMVKRLEVSRNSLADAEETVRLLRSRYENSLSTMVELLDAQTSLNRARADLVENEADYSLSAGRIYYASGIFVKEMLK